MENKLSLSIILPVYKGEKYIENCINYLCNQELDYNDYEIIIINDGSPDNSSEIILRLKKSYSNIVLIETDNKGVGIARNIGLDTAKGQWITFVDQDDLIRTGSLKEIMRNLRCSNDDIVKFSVENLNSTNLNSRLVSGLGPKLSDSIDGIQFYHWYRSIKKYTGIDAPWSIFYNAEFLNKNRLRFVEGIIYMDDAEFLGRVFCLARRCSFYDFPYYLHYENPHSVSNSPVIFSMKAIKGFLLGAEYLKKFRVNNNLSQNQKVFLNNPIAKLVLLVLQQTVNSKCIDYRQYLRLFNELKKSDLKRVDIEGCSSELFFWGRIYNLSMHMFVLMWFSNLALKSLARRIIPYLSQHDHK